MRQCQRSFAFRPSLVSLGAIVGALQYIWLQQDCAYPYKSRSEYDGNLWDGTKYLLGIRAGYLRLLLKLLSVSQTAESMEL